MRNKAGKKKQRIVVIVLGVLASLVLVSNVALLRMLKYAKDKYAPVGEMPIQVTAAPTWHPTHVPTSESDDEETPTPSPSQTPEPSTEPTPEPRDGDIAKNFPIFDIGEGADYSYQDENIRIAITNHVVFPEAYFVADVWVRNLESFKSVFSNGEFRSVYQKPMEIATANNAILAVNTEFNEGYVIRNGKVLRQRYGEKEMLVMYIDGSMASFPSSESKVIREMDFSQIWNTWSFGPTLIKNGEIVKGLNSEGRAPRTAIGYYEPGHYCFLVADGRQQGYAAGMTMTDLAQIMNELGCVEAFNLDGGQSSIMIFQGQVVNQPYHGGRDLANMIVISEGENPFARKPNK